MCGVRAGSQRTSHSSEEDRECGFPGTPLHPPPAPGQADRCAMEFKECMGNVGGTTSESPSCGVTGTPQSQGRVGTGRALGWMVSFSPGDLMMPRT